MPIFFTCLPPEKPRDIAFIPSVLERVQRCQVSYDKIYKRSHYVMLQNFSISTNRCPANMAEQNDMYDFPVRELSLRKKPVAHTFFLLSTIQMAISVKEGLLRFRNLATMVT